MPIQVYSSWNHLQWLYNSWPNPIQFRKVLSQLDVPLKTPTPGRPSTVQNGHQVTNASLTICWWFTMPSGIEDSMLMVLELAELVV